MSEAMRAPGIVGKITLRENGVAVNLDDAESDAIRALQAARDAAFAEYQREWDAIFASACARVRLLTAPAKEG